MKSFFPCSHFGLLAALLWLAVDGRAEEATVSTLTLAAALQRAVAGNPGLAAHGHEERVAEALVEQAGLRPNPTLDVAVENVFGTGRVQGVHSLETTVQASQTFERGGKREKRVALAGRDRDMAAREFEVRRIEVLGATALAYAEVLAARERHALAGEPLKLAREVLAVVDARVKAGAASPAESARARASVAAAQVEFARSEAGVVSTRAALAAKWGGGAADVGRLAGSIQIPETLPDEAVFAAGIGRHPRIEFQRAMIEGRRAALELERAQAVQDITVGGGVRFLREGTDAAFVAGVSVPLPVRNRNQGNIRAARETLAGAELAAGAVQSELRAAFAEAWRDLKVAHDTARSLRRDALPATEEAHAIVRRAYEEGQLALTDVFDAQRALVALRREILDAESACALALVRAEGIANPGFPFTTALFSSK